MQDTEDDVTQKTSREWRGRFYLALIIAILAISGDFFLDCHRDRREQRQAREGLMLAFPGEIDAIEGHVWRNLRTVDWAIKRKKKLAVYASEYPRTIYVENAGNIGDLRDPGLIQGLTSLYSWLNWAENRSDRMVSGATSPYPAALPSYAMDLCSVYVTSYLLDSLLTVRTGNLREAVIRGHMSTIFPERRATAESLYVHMDSIVAAGGVKLE